jgi:outer membrane protein, heavy metal efflux system
MLRLNGRTLAGLVVIAAAADAQTPLSWEQIRERFRAHNPTLKAARLNIDESQAQEVTAYLRPNPQVGLISDGTQLVPQQGVWRPFQGTVLETTFSYLHERQHKRELRRDAARESTVIAQSQYTDQERNLTFNLRSAFVQTLQAKAVLQNAKENLAYWDHELEVNRTRFEAGSLARADFNRLKLQRVQFESDFETAMVNLRTAKIQLLMLLNDRIPIEQFDVAGPFDFTEELKPLEEFRKAALETRPDLKAAVQNIELAKLNHQLAVSNGSTDPTWGAWYSKNP